MTCAPNIARLYETWRAASERWLAIPPGQAATHPDVEPAGDALMAAEGAIDGAAAATAEDVLLKLAAMAPRSKDHDTPEFLTALIGEAVSIVERRRASVIVAGRDGASTFLFADAEAEHFRLEALLQEVERQPLFTDADRAKADADAQTFVDQQLALEEAVYRQPAMTLQDAAIKARFLRRNADADLPEEMTISDAYGYQPQFGERLPRGVASLWADLERLTGAPAIGEHDRRLLAIRGEWEAATAAVNAPGRSDAETEEWSTRQVALEHEAFSLPAEGFAGLAVKAHIAMHNATGGTHNVSPAAAYAGKADGGEACLDEHATLSLWADIQRLSARAAAP